MPKIDLSALPRQTGSTYPAPHDSAMGGRSSLRIGDAAGLTQFGVNLMRLEPGGLSSLRHWHERQDEFLMVTDGVLTLIEDDAETLLRTGDCAAFPAGATNGHHLVNRSDAPAQFLVMGTRTDTEVAWYSDLDMKVTTRDGAYAFTRRDGQPLPPEETQ